MQPESIRLILVRHGEVDANRTYQYLGRRDDELNEKGRNQADALSSALGDLTFDAVVSSPLHRALATAHSVAAVADLAVRTDHRLIELDFGSWEGRSRAELLEKDPKIRAEIESWESDPSCPTPGGESLQDLQRRVVEFADALAHEQPGATVVVVSHMGPIKTLLCAALGLSLDAAGRVFLDPATVSVIDWGPRPVVRLVNSHSHLGFANARWLKAQ